MLYFTLNDQNTKTKRVRALSTHLLTKADKIELRRKQMGGESPHWRHLAVAERVSQRAGGFAVFFLVLGELR